LPARPLGKWKATIQFLAVGLVLLPWTADHDAIGLTAIWAATALTIISGIDMVRASRAGGAAA
jgi:phosphatidylglycerophosphate synthase